MINDTKVILTDKESELMEIIIKKIEDNIYSDTVKTPYELAREISKEVSKLYDL